MFPFWDVVDELLAVCAPRRVVEIGALRGDTTVRLLDVLPDDAELHVIDPEPQFDPAEHERRFGGRYVFHRDISHDVLRALPAVDVALVDGDHNWYTVSNELRLLDEAAARAATPLPLVLLHDVAWPYGRRDGYYAPERIPPEWRQPCARAGIERGRDELVPGGGINGHIHNADHEGGARNGVLTAVEDFVAARQPEPRLVVIPVFVGFGIVADGARLAVCPGLAEHLDALDGDAGRARVTALAHEALHRARAGDQSTRS